MFREDLNSEASFLNMAFICRPKNERLREPDISLCLNLQECHLFGNVRFSWAIFFIHFLPISSETSAGKAVRAVSKMFCQWQRSRRLRRTALSSEWIRSEERIKLYSGVCIRNTLQEPARAHGVKRKEPPYLPVSVRWGKSNAFQGRR